jgi:peptide chain release factor 1
MNTVPPYLKPQLEKIEKQMAETKSLLADPDMADLAKNELLKLEKQKNQLTKALKVQENGSLKDHDFNTRKFKNCLLEIRPAAGGEEAKIWAHDLLRMYTRFANQQGFDVEQIDELSLRIKGKNAYQALKYESGVHRVQRVPETEKNGRIHTSTASVAVLPIIPAAEIEIKPDDLSWNFSRAGGHGGQNVNKVATAVELTHKPTDLVIKCRQERSQQQNKEIALEMLRSLLWKQQEEKRLEKIESKRRQAVGRGMRAEKIRTYNYPQDRVTDHRLTKKFRLENIMEGNLEKIMELLSRT